MVGWQMNDEQEKIWKEAVVAHSRQYPGICLEGLRKPMKYHSQNSRCSARDSNRESLEYVSRALPLCQPAQFSIRATHQTNYTSDITVTGEKPKESVFRFVFTCLETWNGRICKPQQIIIKMVISRRPRRAAHVACSRKQKRNEYEF
jgi:hypothetical protein